MNLPSFRLGRRRRPGRESILLFLSLVILTPGIHATELSGEIGGDFRAFIDPPLDTRQHNGNFSAYVQPELYHALDNNKQSITFELFYRLDENDEERTHGDLREFYWEKARDKYEVRVGIRKVFWGVIETKHLVDVINQTDLVENIDGEDKLGQPMVNLALVQNWGTVNLFVMPWFRERTFPGVEGRFRSPIPVDTDLEQYEAAEEERHIDLAARWSHYIGVFDFGLAFFTGTGRDPTLLPTTDTAGAPVLFPYYEIIDQWSLDAQATLGNWLWKFEGINRNRQGGRMSAGSLGVEYTFVGILGQPWDLGALVEYHADDRNRKAVVLLDDDYFVGTRFVLNDTQSTEFLGGLVQDRDNGSTSTFVEFSRRLTNNFKLYIEGRTIHSNNRSDASYPFRKDSSLQTELIFFF